MSLPEALSEVTAQLASGDFHVLFLVGDLGAGKTHFVNQLAQEIGISRRLPSPTFTFLQEYPCDWNDKRKLIHCDFYRIEPDNAEKTLEQIGFWDYFDERNIVCIEWPERADTVVKDITHKTLHIALNQDDTRTYELT